MNQITTQELKNKINNKENFVLDLYATWCGPCRVMLYNLTNVSDYLSQEPETKPQYNIYKYDIDSDKEFVVNELGIRSVPTIKIFKEGQEVFSKAGVMSANEVINLIS